MAAWWLSSWSQPTIDAAYRVGGWLSIVAAAIALISGVVTVFVGNERDRRSGDEDVARDLRAAILQEKVNNEAGLRAQLAKDLEAEQSEGRFREQIAEQREREREATISRLRSELGEAQQLASSAQQRAAEAERNIANATSEQRPRELTPDQQKAFLAVATKRPKGRLQVAMVNPDREVPYYFKQVLDLVKRAGWEVVSTTTMADVSAYGLVLVGRQDTEVTAAVQGLLEALRAAGESPRVEVAPWAPDGYPQLLVGYRPIQPAGTR